MALRRIGVFKRRGPQTPQMEEKWLQLLSNQFRSGAFLVGTATLTPSSVAATSTAEQDFTVIGLKAGDAVFVNKPTHQSGLGIVGFRVKADDTLSITYHNSTGIPITPTAAEDYTIGVIAYASS